MNNQSLVELAVRLAEAAAVEILAVRDAGFTVQSKDDTTPVTLADMRAEKVITAGLREATPYIPVIAEEEVAAGKITDPGAEFWLVDPLDGTREFAAGRPEYAVNIGLVRNGKVVLAAVAAPATHEVYYGIIGVGAWKKSAAGTAAISARKAPAEGLTIMASRHYQDDPELAAYLAQFKIASVTNIGSALKFCYLAEGKADFYPRLGRTMEWDTAAPQAVLEAAGGCVLTMDGAPMGYGKPGFENPHFVCWGRR
ncbi:MAG TPA: 3'(2'),5'-bisphosphate nucleotidase CysQ [Acidocella sp.]|nr:3'(2'),5'-bisphosphate nucleotidase CysQ [Acidocella sp.]